MLPLKAKSTDLARHTDGGAAWKTPWTNRDLAPYALPKENENQYYILMQHPTPAAAIPELLPTLATLRVGQQGHVMAIDTIQDDANNMDERLMEMGLTPGTPVRIIHCGPFGDPIQLWVRGYMLSLRREDAQRIRIARVAP